MLYTINKPLTVEYDFPSSKHEYVSKEIAVEYLNILKDAQLLLQSTSINLNDREVARRIIDKIDKAITNAEK